MQEILLHSWGDPKPAGGYNAICRSKNYVNSYDEDKRERYSARGLGLAGQSGKLPYAVEILHDPLSKEEGGFSCNARFKRKEFKEMMAQGVVTEGTIIFTDKCKWIITKNKGSESQRKVKVKK